MTDEDKIRFASAIVAIHNIAREHDMAIEVLLVAPTGTEDLSIVPAWGSNLDGLEWRTSALDHFVATRTIQLKVLHERMHDEISASGSANRETV